MAIPVIFLHWLGQELTILMTNALRAKQSSEGMTLLWSRRRLEYKAGFMGDK